MPVKKYPEIERRLGRPLPEVLKAQFEKHGHERRAQQVIADELGISQSRLSQLIRECGLVPKTILIDERGAKRDAGDGHTSPVEDGQLSFLG